MLSAGMDSDFGSFPSDPAPGFDALTPVDRDGLKEGKDELIHLDQLDFP